MCLIDKPYFDPLPTFKQGTWLLICRRISRSRLMRVIWKSNFKKTPCSFGILRLNGGTHLTGLILFPYYYKNWWGKSPQNLLEIWVGRKDGGFHVTVNHAPLTRLSQFESDPTHRSKTIPVALEDGMSKLPN